MSAAMMQAWIWRQFGALDGLQPEMRPVPQPGPGEVLLRVRANSLNQRDLMAARGALPRNGQPNVVPLCDGAGEIVAIGDGVRRSEEHTSELQSLMRISYAVFCLQKKN